MRFPFWRQAPEPAAEPADYTDAMIAAAAALRLLTESAAVETALGVWSRGLSAANARGLPGYVAPLGAAHFAQVGRDLLLSGNSLWRIDLPAGSGALSLTRASTVFDVWGGASPASWRYGIDLPGPSGYERSSLPGSGVVHYRLPGADAWRGLSPVRDVKRLDAAAQRANEQEAAKLAVDVLAVGSQAAANVEKAARKLGLKGLLPLIAASQQPGQGDVQAAWVDPGRIDPATGATKTATMTRLGPAPPAGMVEILNVSAARVYGAAGIPPSLYGVLSNGAGDREAYRRLGALTLKPVLELLEGELREKLEAPALALELGDLAAADMAGRARSVKALREAGVELPRALEMVGLPADPGSGEGNSNAGG